MSMTEQAEVRKWRTAIAIGLGLVAIVLLANPVQADVFTVYSDNADGAVYGGAFSSQDLIVGGATGANYSGIAIFELPDLGNLALASATVDLTVVSAGTMPTANADVWGLGYLTGTPAMSGSWVLISDTETRDGNTLGTNIGTDLPVKIVDDVVAAGTTMTTGTVTQVDVTAFLKSLYDTYGAAAGDYAVIRINADADQYNVYGASSNFRYGGSHRGTNAALLTVTAVPEPGTLVLLGTCLLGLAPLVWRRRRG